MSCPTATAPIDISIANIKGKCSYKCSYSFHYNNSSCIITNRGNYLSLSYDKSSTPPVIYNSTNYDVEEVRLYIPSLHSYSGSKSDGELIVVHTSNVGTSPLLVCVPIKSNNVSNNSSLLFQTIINTASNNAPADGESTTVNVTNYNLSDLIPNKPFFSYTATEPYQPCSNIVDYIVYIPLNGALDIMPDTLTKLESIISSNPYDIKKGPNLFYNEKGPSQIGDGDGEIYIDCQPVGHSEETTQTVTNNNNPISFKDWLKEPIVKLILGSLLFIVILFIIKYGLNLIQPSKSTQTISQLIKGNLRT